MDERLKKFARLVERKSFTQAAKDLHISQPALSLAIDKLERELKTPLLVRASRGFQLTDAGQIVYSAAVEHRTADDNLRTKLTDLAGRRPQVVIGMIDSVAAALNDDAQALDRLEAAADVSIIVNHSRYLRAAVENREIDLAIAVHDNAVHPNLDVDRIGSEPFMLVCEPGRYDYFHAALKAKELPDFISYDRTSTTYGHIHAGLRRIGIDTPPILHSTSPTIMLHSALRGRGVAALPYVLAKELLEAGRLSALRLGRDTITIDCPLDIVKLRGRLLSRVLDDFSAQAQAALADIALQRRQGAGLPSKITRRSHK